MTANATESDRNACLQAGMDDHVGKPVRLEDLARVLSATPRLALVRTEAQTLALPLATSRPQDDPVARARALARLAPGVAALRRAVDRQALDVLREEARALLEALGDSPSAALREPLRWFVEASDAELAARGIVHAAAVQRAHRSELARLAAGG